MDQQLLERSMELVKENRRLRDELANRDHPVHAMVRHEARRVFADVLAARCGDSLEEAIRHAESAHEAYLARFGIKVLPVTEAPGGV